MVDERGRPFSPIRAGLYPFTSPHVASHSTKKSALFVKGHTAECCDVGQHRSTVFILYALHLTTLVSDRTAMPSSDRHSAAPRNASTKTLTAHRIHHHLHRSPPVHSFLSTSSSCSNQATSASTSIILGNERLLRARPPSELDRAWRCALYAPQSKSSRCKTAALFLVETSVICVV